MKITLFAETSLGLDLDCIVENTMKLAPALEIVKGKSAFKIRTPLISAPKTYQQLSPAVMNECADSDYVALFTGVQYDNNFFWEGVDNKSIISFWGWDSLTRLPMDNGAVLFLCATILQNLDIGVRHGENTGCINDIWMDKTGVDLGMKVGLVCAECLRHFRANGDKSHKKVLSQIQAVLNDLGTASRSELDICAFWKRKYVQDGFDVFLCHNVEDKDFLREMNTRLKKAGVITWFDEEQLPPGRIWQQLLEDQIGGIKSAAVFVGANGLGPWQDIEGRAFLSEFAKRRCPVIPVILPDCTNVPQLPMFLRQFTWVDFRKTIPDPFSQLVWGITGRKL